MSSLLYYSISSDLTEKQIIEIDKNVAIDQEKVYLFLIKLPSNSKRKAKRLLLYGIVAFLLGQPLVTREDRVISPVPLLPAINKLLSSKENNSSINIPHGPRIILIRTKSDLRNSPAIKELVSEIRGGSDVLDEELIKSIVSKVSESGWDIPSINKMLKKLAEGSLEIATNSQIMRILAELEKPITESPLTGTSSSIFVEGWQPKFSRHGKKNPVTWQKENKCSTPTPDFLFDTTKCYGHREGFNMPRSVSERFETNAVRKVAKTSLKNSLVEKEYEFIKKEIEQGIHPVNLSSKSTYISSTKVLVKKGEGRYIVDVSETHADIVGFSSRTDKKCMSKFKRLMNELYGLDIKGY